MGDFVGNDCFMLDDRVALKYTFGGSVVSQNMWRQGLAEFMI